MPNQENSLSVFPTIDVSEDWMSFFVDGLALLSTMLPPNKRIGDAVIAGYAFAMRDMTKDQLRLAFGAAIQQCKFLPSPAELRELAGVNGDPVGAIAIMAWEAVSAAVVRCGSYNSPLFEDGRISAVIKTMGGWVRFCETPEDVFDQHTRREFLKTYSILSKRPQEPERLAGIYECTNGINGFILDHTFPVASPYLEGPSRPAITVDAVPVGLKSLAMHRHAITDGGVG